MAHDNENRKHNIFDFCLWKSLKKFLSNEPAGGVVTLNQILN